VIEKAIGQEQGRLTFFGPDLDMRPLLAASPICGVECLRQKDLAARAADRRMELWRAAGSKPRAVRTKAIAAGHGDRPQGKREIQ